MTGWNVVSTYISVPNAVITMSETSMASPHTAAMRLSLPMLLATSFITDEQSPVSENPVDVSSLKELSKSKLVESLNAVRGLPRDASCICWTRSVGEWREDACARSYPCWAAGTDHRSVFAEGVSYILLYTRSILSHPSTMA